MPELLPTKVSYTPGEPVKVEVRGLEAPAAATVYHLGDPVTTVEVVADGIVDFGPLDPGGYGVELGASRTAVEVTGDRRAGLRYGFVADYRPDRDLDAVTDNLRRLHLTAVQFYDWAYRHADLLGGGDRYDDALGQPVSLDTVASLVKACHQVGADALGYAAVYGVGRDEWPDWQHRALLQPSGEPYGLGDFLDLVDPSAPDWLAHFTGDLRAAVSRAGFDGFHLDQYGYPKRAVRPDGETVDLAEAFGSLIDGVRAELPEARLVFNNVNDFPTWRTGAHPQDAVYVEVWPPHVTLDHLADVVRRARAAGQGKPVVIAAYQHVYDSASTEASDLATALTMATLFSHGATHLLAGEADRILVDPYYVRNHRTEASTAALLKRWYDFLVEHAELLLPATIADVTGSYTQVYNDDCDVTYAGVEVADAAQPGAVWRRVTEASGRLVVHLVNLTGQTDALWDAPRETPGDPGPAVLRVRRTGANLPRVRVADPDRGARLVDVPVRIDGDHAVADLPAPHLWQLVLIDPT
ncbi:glycoside hydrolase family 66 protein [Kribbella sp. HUAS MG21]|uniref:Glycoside hydrolase family 66 protein n=1 Tax=Kribbella sp. HUAS MG21 TaxID=3160966 RepID=A0AAU7T6D2_9ACTN